MTALDLSGAAALSRLTLRSPYPISPLRGATAACADFPLEPLSDLRVFLFQWWTEMTASLGILPGQQHRQKEVIHTEDIELPRIVPATPDGKNHA
jgi:hypothetical protein